MTFEPMKNGVALLRVNDVEAARAELERAGVEFKGDTSIPACVTWRRTRTG